MANTREGASDVERQLTHYQRDPFYRFTEGEARLLADEVLRLRETLTVAEAYIPQRDFADYRAESGRG